MSSKSLVGQIAGETVDWLAEDRSRDDVADEVWAFALATVVDGRPITPRGYDESRRFASWCVECGADLTDEPEGSTICRRCLYHDPRDSPADGGDAP